MDLNPYVVLGSAVVGLLVGLTGAGGGALMTPMLILLFNVKPCRGDLQRPGRRRGDAAGRVAGAHAQGHRQLPAGRLDVRGVGADGVPRLVPAAPARRRRRRSSRTWSTRSAPRCWPARRRCCCAPGWTGGPGRRGRRPSRRCGSGRLATVAIGAVGGLVVGMTSVGSGSLMIVLLLFTYPALAGGAARRDRPDPGGAADRGRRARRAAVRARAVRADDGGHHRLGARRADRVAAVLAGARPVHQAGHHLRDLRLRAQVRGPRHHGARLDAVPGRCWPAAGTGWCGTSPGAARAGRWRPADRRRGQAASSRGPAGARSCEPELGTAMPQPR